MVSGRVALTIFPFLDMLIPMNRQNQPLRDALLRVLIKGEGVIAFQRRFQRLRAELPDLGVEHALERLLKPGAAAVGDAEVSLAGDIRVTTLLDDDFPLMLRHIADPPLALFYTGSLATLHRPAISLVGSRACTTYGLQTTTALAGSLARLGFVIVSGLALGIDARAHGACLEAGGRTAAVLGSGVDRIYPREHQALAHRIEAAEGVILSEFPPGSAPKPFHFPIRNRLISGLSHATIVVEAKERSGSLITARHCLDQGRELFAVPGSIHRATSLGANRLISRGEARLLLSVDEVLAQLRPLLGLAAEHQSLLNARIRDPVAMKIYERLDAFEPMPLDILVAELGLDAGTVLAKLVELESLNLVEGKPGQHYLRNPLHPAL